MWLQKAVLWSVKVVEQYLQMLSAGCPVPAVSAAFTVDVNDLTLTQLNILYNSDVRLEHERSCFSNCSVTYIDN